MNTPTASGTRMLPTDRIAYSAIAERPKLSAYKTAIRERIASLLDLPLDCVGFKAKTGERVGPVGREEAIMAEAVVLLERIPT